MIARLGLILVQAYLVVHHGRESEAGRTGRLSLKFFPVTTSTNATTPLPNLPQLPEVGYKTVVTNTTDLRSNDTRPTRRPLDKQVEGDIPEKPLKNVTEDLLKVCGLRPVPTDKLAGGEVSSPGAWPWMALLYLESGKTYDQHCGGVVVSNQHVLTAAHCVVQEVINDPTKAFRVMNHRLFVVRLAEHDVTDTKEITETVDLSAKRVLVHPDYNYILRQHDIAMLVLSVELEFSDYIQPICLPYGEFPTDDKLPGETVYVTGWGDKSFGGATSHVLRQARLTLVSNEDCQQTVTGRNITDDMMCAWHEKNDSCQRDSGGPLNYFHNKRYYVAGIVSYGPMCGSGSPGIYSRVSSHMDWITMVITHPDIGSQRHHVKSHLEVN